MESDQNMEEKEIELTDDEYTKLMQAITDWKEADADRIACLKKIESRVNCEGNRDDISKIKERLSYLFPDYASKLTPGTKFFDPIEEGIFVCWEILLADNGYKYLAENKDKKIILVPEARTVLYREKR